MSKTMLLYVLTGGGGGVSRLPMMNPVVLPGQYVQLQAVFNILVVLVLVGIIVMQVVYYSKELRETKEKMAEKEQEIERLSEKISLIKEINDEWVRKTTMGGYVQESRISGQENDHSEFEDVLEKLKATVEKTEFEEAMDKLKESAEKTDLIKQYYEAIGKLKQDKSGVSLYEASEKEREIMERPLEKLAEEPLEE